MPGLYLIIIILLTVVTASSTQHVPSQMVMPQTTSVNKFMEKLDPDEKYLVLKPAEGLDSDPLPLLLPVSNATQNQVDPEFKRELNYYKRLSHKLSLVISPILLIIGGIGNPLCIIILLQKRKPNSTIIYLCLLAVVDVLVLYTGLLRQYLKEILNIDLRDYSSLTCKLHIFLTYTFMQISSYILVSVTVNRLTITYNRSIFCKQITPPNPNARQTNEPTKTVFIIFILICIFVSIWNVHFLIYYGLFQDGKESQFVDDCTIDKIHHSSYYRFRTEYYSQMHLYLFIALPCCILFVSNILIIKKIMQLSNPRLRANGSNRGRNDDHAARKKEKKKTRLSIMLLAVCLWFMVLKTPASVYITFPVTEMNKSHFPFTYTVFMLINYTNHAVNLILYILTSATFRRDFKQVLCLGRPAPNPTPHEHDNAGQEENMKLNNVGIEAEDE